MIFNQLDFDQLNFDQNQVDQKGAVLLSLKTPKLFKKYLPVANLLYTTTIQRFLH